MSDKCSNNHFLWLTKSCFPTSNNHPSTSVHHPIATALSISVIPDDLLLDILSRLPHSSFSSISLVCRRWAHLLHSTAFHHLRRLHNRLSSAVFVISLSPSAFLSSTHRLILNFPWTLVKPPALQCISRAFPPECFSHARVVSVGPKIYVISRSTMLSYNTWSSGVVMEPGMINPRKKFAVAVVNGKIYVSGGACRANAVEEYDPFTGKWRVVAAAPRKRYGCIGASVDGIFYVIGGLKIGACASHAVTGAEANAYPSSMDLYDVEAREWLKSQTVPGGGCVVAACGAGGYLYVLASHAVELSFWRFNGCRRSEGYKEWRRIDAPPLPAQVRVDSSVRFSCIGIGEKVMLIQVMGCIDDLLRRSGRTSRGFKEGLVLIFDSTTEEWSRAADLPENITRAAAVCVEC